MLIGEIKKLFYFTKCRAIKMRFPVQERKQGFHLLL
jgi:hypothetical protein